MPTTIVTPITRETFKPYAKLGKSNGKIQGRICDLLLRLVQTDDPAKVKELCLAEVAWLESEYSNPNTRTSYITAERKAIAAYFAEHQPPASLLSEYKGASQHLALCHLFAADEDYAQKSAGTKAKTAKQRDNLTGFDAAAAVSQTKTLLRSSDWRELAAGLIMASQSRPSDMLKSGEFKAVSKYRLSFTSRAKKRGKAVTGEIFCLVEAVTFIDAFSRLRRMPEIIEMKDWTLAEIDSGKNKTLNRTVRRAYGEIIPVPFGETELSCKNLRASGVNAAYWLHGRDNQSIGRFAELQLLHDNAGTAANYEDYYAAAADGKRLLEVGTLTDEPLTAKPQSEQRSSITVDAQLRDVIGDAELWGEGSNADRLERIIARAKQADRLERQLAIECEKRLRAELDLKRLEQAAPAELVATEAKAKPTAAAAAEPSGFDWRDVPNAELNGDRRHDAYAEKLRRSVEAIQEYNAGRYSDEQFAITGSLLRQLTGVKPGKVKDWMLEHDSELSAYADELGHGARQNVGKPEPREVIKW
ncbi:MAG: protelomerase family protein, partial [Phormidesmis sp.]